MQTIKDIPVNNHTVLVAVAMVCLTAILIVAISPLLQTANWLKYGFSYIILIGIIVYNVFFKK